MMDADGSTTAARSPASSVHCSRVPTSPRAHASQGGGTDDITFSRHPGNRILRLVIRFFGSRYSDLCYGYNAFWASTCRS